MGGGGVMVNQIPAPNQPAGTCLPSSAFCILLSAFRFLHSAFYLLPSTFCFPHPPLLQSLRVLSRFPYASRTSRHRLRFRGASRPFHRVPMPRTQPHSRPGIDRVRRRPDQWPRRQERLAPSSRRRKNHSRNHRAPAHPRRSRIHSSRGPLRRRRRHRHQQTRRHDRARRRRRNLRHARQRAPRPRPVSFAVRRSLASRHRASPGQGNFRRNSRRQKRRRSRQTRRSLPPAQSEKNLHRPRAGPAQGKKRPHRAGHRPRPYPSHAHGGGAQDLARRRHDQSPRRPHRLAFPRHHRQYHARRSPTPHWPHASDSCALLRSQTSRRRRHALRCRRPTPCRENGAASARPQFSPCRPTRHPLLRRNLPHPASNVRSKVGKPSSSPSTSSTSSSPFSTAATSSSLLWIKPTSKSSTTNFPRKSATSANSPTFLSVSASCWTLPTVSATASNSSRTPPSISFSPSFAATKTKLSP